MNDEILNMSIRRYLKKVGITSQREIEKTINQADVDGQLDGNPLRVKMTLECDILDQPLVIEDEINYQQLENFDTSYYAGGDLQASVGQLGEMTRGICQHSTSCLSGSYGVVVRYVTQG